MIGLEKVQRPNPEKQQAVCDALIQRILIDPTFRVRLEARMRNELSTYGNLSADQMRAIPALQWAAMSADGQSFVDPGTFERFFSAGQTRARQGVPAGEMLQTYRILHQELRRRAREILAGMDNHEQIVLELFERGIAYVDAAMAITAEGHRAGELEMRWRDDHHHSTIVRKVLIDHHTGPSLLSELEAFGIDWTGAFHAIRVRPGPGTNLDTLRQFMQQPNELGHRTGLVALIDRDLCGFVSAPPTSAAPTVIGISERTTFTELPRAFERATRALSTALAFELPCGIYDLGSLGVRAAVTADYDVGRELYRRFLLPFEKKGEQGTAIVDTIRRYLANDSRLDITADELWLHSNTIRYRINRFESLTGCSLKDTADLVAVWWALQYDQARGHSASNAVVEESAS